MEGVIPFVYKAILQYRCSGTRMYGALAAAASSSPGDSGRFYVRLPGDSGRFVSDIHGSLPSPRSIYRPASSPQSPSPNNAVNKYKNGSATTNGSLCRKTSIGVTSAPGFSAGQRAKST